MQPRLCKRRRDKWPLVVPAGTSQSIAQSWLLRLSLGVLSGPTALSFHGTAAPGFGHRAAQQLDPAIILGSLCRARPRGCRRVRLETETGCAAEGLCCRRAVLKVPQLLPTSLAAHLHFCSAKHHAKAASVTGRARRVTDSRSNKLSP